MTEADILTLLDPQVRAFAEMRKQAGIPDLRDMGVDGVRALMAHVPPAPAPDMAEVFDRIIAGPHGDIPVRIYRPHAPSPEGDPVLLYFHGGGMIMGTLDSYDALCRTLAAQADVVVVSVDYRLAPEYVYPVANDEAYAALKWLHANAATLQLDKERIGVGGDSAGGGLAAALALQARDEGGPSIRAQFLFYAGVDRIEAYPSAEVFAKAPMLTTPDVIWMKNLYLGEDPAKDTPYGVPARAEDLGGLPPAVVVTAEVDPVRDSAEAYGERLRAARVPTVLMRYPGVCHGFLSQTHNVDRAAEAMAEVAGLISNKLQRREQ